MTTVQPEGEEIRKAVKSTGKILSRRFLLSPLLPSPHAGREFCFPPLAGGLRGGSILKNFVNSAFKTNFV